MTRRTIAAVLAVFLGASGLALGVLALALRDGGGGLREGHHSLITPMSMRIAAQGSRTGWAITAIVLAVLAVAAGLAAFWALRRASEPAAAGPAPG